MLKQRRHAKIAQQASVKLIQQYALHVTKDTTKNKLVNRSVCHAFLENINQKKERSNVKIVGKIRSQKTLHKQPANILVLDLLS